MCAVLMSQNEELTLAQVAQRLGISYQTALRRVTAKKIRARKEGLEWRVRESDLEKYIEGTYKDGTEKDAEE